MAGLWALAPGRSIFDLMRQSHTQPERSRPMTSGADQNELERIVRIALSDDAAHREMWSALPGGPEEVPALLTELESDLNDWGFAYGVAWAVAKARYPHEPDRVVAERALGAARTVFGEYCAGADWPERLTDRPIAHDEGSRR
jgi:hypothetical protein